MAARRKLEAIFASQDAMAIDAACLTIEATFERLCQQPRDWLVQHRDGRVSVVPRHP